MGLAIYGAVNHFRRMLEAHYFNIFPGHKPIANAFQQKRDKCSPRQFNHYTHFAAQFTTDIQHISGQANVAADVLSRVESVTARPSNDTHTASQDSDEKLKILLESTTSLRLEKLPIPCNTVPINCDTSTARSPPYVPAPLRLLVFQYVNDMSHPGTNRRRSCVAQHFMWPNVQ
jgi:hypothetical protein